MSAKYFTVTCLLAYAQARFSQEQIPNPAVTSLDAFGQPGQADSLGGGVPGVLLASANPCDKVRYSQLDSHL